MTNPTSSNLTAPLPGDNLPAAQPPAPAPFQPKKGLSFRRLFRNKATVAGGIIVVLIVLVALVSMFWTPHFYDEQDLSRSLLPPFWMDGADPAYPLGTDLNGRDLLSRLMVGA